MNLRALQTQPDIQLIVRQQIASPSVFVLQPRQSEPIPRHGPTLLAQLPAECFELTRYRAIRQSAGVLCRLDSLSDTSGSFSLGHIQIPRRETSPEVIANGRAG